MSTRFAFAGFRHGHIMGLLAEVEKADDACVVGACEEDEATRESLLEEGRVELTHPSLDALLDEVDCDVIAIGDVYGKRGSIAVRALETGRHVILDKPVCTSLDELSAIDALSRENGLSVGCQLDMRSNPTRMTMRRLILDGAIGEVQTVCFSGQHPLMYGTRADWYFQEGCHGGSINDIAIHAMDWIPWMTGREIVEIVAARVWNGKTPQAPFFQDGAQFMLKLDNGGGVLGDVSYLAPDRCGYKARQYWRITVHGTGGVMETQCGDPDVFIATHDDTDPRTVPGEHDGSKGYFRDFMDELQGNPSGTGLTSERVLRAARLALMTQDAADRGLTGVPCP